MQLAQLYQQLSQDKVPHLVKEEVFSKVFPLWNRIKHRHYKQLVMKGMQIPSAKDLGNLMGYSALLLRVCLQQQPQYQTFAIPKKRGGTRTIAAPNKILKAVQHRINRWLQAYYILLKPQEVHGFVRYGLLKHCHQSNIVENAKPHVGKNYLLNIDLKDFFPSISAQKIKQVFSSPLFVMPSPIATALTRLCTHEGKLPIGAPTSPVLANFVCLPLDRELIAFCKAHHLTYTRYADDLSFSSQEKIGNSILSEIREILTRYGFEINNKKLRLQSKNQHQSVTGIVVNQKLNVDRTMLKNIRAMLHCWETKGYSAASAQHFGATKMPSKRQEQYFQNRLGGLINFLGQVRGKNDAIYQKYRTAFDKLYVPADERV